MFDEIDGMLFEGKPFNGKQSKLYLCGHTNYSPVITVQYVVSGRFSTNYDAVTFSFSSC